jgi:hypothetical protein
MVLFVLTHTEAQVTWEGIEHNSQPWVKNASRPFTVSHGMEGRHLSLCASHGRYYDQAKGYWKWQRPALYTTCEDLFTQTIVVPFLIPMLENAGAVVFTPRERDWQRHEVIVDNDYPTRNGKYWEAETRYEWQPAPDSAFAQHKDIYQDGENPFKAGTARMVKATKNKSKLTVATYQPVIPESGRYAVYVSYQSLPESVDDAHYTVWHQGQRTEYRVNQQMGGSTWVYLGTFDFDQGYSTRNRVELTNLSEHNGVVTADAVRFGGGMGNIEREGETSQMPRCLEGARYFAQWAGMPYRVYSSKGGVNDYADDINARSLMLNELCGGSVYAPDSTGRNVPIELSVAVHSDAGYNEPDGEGVYGTLTICTTQHGDSLLAAGRSRDMSHELACDLLDNTVNDLQYKYKEWAIREVYDRNYSETRVPVVPSAIIETLSHQSFADMRYGLDPNFRFTLARSIYKTLLRYTARKHKKKYAVSPLTPHGFKIEFLKDGKGEVQLEWQPTPDEQEPTANADGYVLYLAEGDNGFDNGTLIHSTTTRIKLTPDVLYHFRVAAVNSGGCSFPSQVLSACYRSDKAKNILVVDGFHRLSSPAIKGDGFDIDQDPGVSYGRTCGLKGRQIVFDHSRIGIEDSTGLGFTSKEWEGKFIGGNEFNYVQAHAQSIHQAGNYNIVSCSSEALPLMQLYQYQMLDIVLGLECNDGHSLVAYKAFTPAMRSALSQYAAQGGRLLVSGAYIGSDMQAADEKLFLSKVLKCRHAGTYRSESDTVRGLGTTLSFYHQLCEEHYAATACDVLVPDDGAFSAMVYADQTSAATAYKGSDYRTLTVGFPIECIKTVSKRNSIMKGFLNFLLQ